MASRVGILLLCCILSSFPVMQAQDSIPHKRKSTSVSKKRATAEELQGSLERKDVSASAKQYETLADEYTRQGEHAQAEYNYGQALKIYQERNDKTKVSEISRKLARSQELQNKKEEAIQSYSNAAMNTTDADRSINFNDAKRLQSPSNTASQRSYIQQNIDLLERQGEKEKAAEAYQQLAKVSLEEKNIPEAAKTLEKAISVTKSPEQKTEIKQQLAEVYAIDQKYAEAISISRKLLEEAEGSGNIPLQLEQLQQLYIYHKEARQDTTSVIYLDRAYKLAIQEAYTKEAKQIAALIAGHYSDKGDYKRSLIAYDQFFKDLDTLLIKDKSLVDEKILSSTEARIRELEKERALQAQVIKSKNRFNYFLLASIAAMLLLSIFIIRSLLAIKKKNKKIALQSLRREMNPHFIFNSLNSVNQFIAENDELKANKYLASYSGLMRNVMEHSNKDFVPLSTEIEQLKQYLELEHLRFKDKFDFILSTDPGIDTDAILIPNMLLQPQIENAIWHGLRYKEEKGTLKIEFNLAGSHIIAGITDDGIGIEQSKAMKTTHQRSYRSIGIHNTKERIALLNSLYHMDISMDTTSSDEGTHVVLRFPVKEK